MSAARPACRRSGTASAWRRNRYPRGNLDHYLDQYLLAVQAPAAFSQPKRIGKPSPPMSVMDS